MMMMMTTMTVATLVQQQCNSVRVKCRRSLHCDCWCVHITGVRTGRCITSPDKPPKKSCEIYGWCPVENDRLPLYATLSHYWRLFISRVEHKKLNRCALRKSSSRPVSKTFILDPCNEYLNTMFNIITYTLRQWSTLVVCKNWFIRKARMLHFLCATFCFPKQCSEHEIIIIINLNVQFNC